MKAVIKWQGGEHVIEDAALGDSRVEEFLDQLAERKAQGVTLTFEDDFFDGAELIGLDAA